MRCIYNMSAKPTLYETLNVKKDATDVEIKKAYRTLSLIHHPDRGGDAEMFKIVSEAYETLSDPHKRNCYDAEISGSSMMFDGNMNNLFQTLFQTHRPGGPFGPGGQGGPGIHIFHNMGGPGIAEQFAGHPFFANFVKPQTIHKEIVLSLEQAFVGGTVTVEIDRFIVRPDNSRTSDKKTVEVQIEPGIENEEVIVLANIGNVVQGITGDVKVTVHVVPHARFTREGLDLHYTEEITLCNALCGFNFNVTLLNKQTITIKNTQPPVKIVYPDMEQVCPGHGLRKGNTVGNLVIHFKVIFPESITEEKQLMLKGILESLE